MLLLLLSPSSCSSWWPSWRYETEREEGSIISAFLGPRFDCDFDGNGRATGEDEEKMLIPLSLSLSLSPELVVIFISPDIIKDVSEGGRREREGKGLKPLQWASAQLYSERERRKLESSQPWSVWFCGDILSGEKKRTQSCPPFFPLLPASSRRNKFLRIEKPEYMKRENEQKRHETNEEERKKERETG